VIYDATDIPQVLGSALDRSKRPQTARGAWAEFARVYAIGKRAEYEEFLHVISRAETRAPVDERLGPHRLREPSGEDLTIGNRTTAGRILTL